MRVTLRLEDDHKFIFDLQQSPGPIWIRQEICGAVLAWSSSADGVRRVSTVENVRRTCSVFLRWIRQTKVGGDKYEIECSADLTPFHLVRFRQFVEDSYATGSFTSYYIRFCRLLQYLPVDEDVLLLARKRRVRPNAEVQRIERYNESDFRTILKAARNVLRRAHRRIEASYAEALLGQDAGATPRQRALLDVLEAGEPRSREGWHALDGWRHGRGHRASVQRMMYPDADEVMAGAVIIACMRGLNLSAIEYMKVPLVMSDSIVQLDVDKPRRGPTARHWAEIVDDAGEDKGVASVIRMIAEMTHPLREHLAGSGHPTDRLLVRWAGGRFPMQGVRRLQRPSWFPLSEPLSFNRLRRSVPIAGVGREPTHHSVITHLHYVRTDPEALKEHQHSASIAVEEALDRARSEVAVRQVDATEISPANDALIANCADPEHHPVTGHPCTSGYFSFLDCLDCDNAMTTERLLPRQMAALEVLERLRDVAGEDWSDAYHRRFLMLRALIERRTSAEREQAAARTASFHPIVLAALRHEIPESHEHLFS